MKPLPAYIENAVVSLLAPHVAGIDGATLWAALELVASRRGVTIEQAATLAGVCRKTIERAVAAGRLAPVCRRGKRLLYDPASLAGLVK
jgi:hypothetical protein